MNGYGLGFALTKYLMQAFFYAAKMDKRMLTIDNGNRREIHERQYHGRGHRNFEAVFQGLQSCSDKDLERYAENVAYS